MKEELTDGKPTGVEAAGGGAPDPAEENLKTIADVLEYLKGDGWKVTKSSLYRHRKEGKFIPVKDGTFRRKDVHKYARTFLKQRSTGLRINEQADSLQRRKLQRELERLEIGIKREQLAFDRDQGKYISRERMEIELAGRAAVLDAGLRHWIMAKAGEWTRAVGGDARRIGELIHLMLQGLDEHINEYAKPITYEVRIVDDEDDERREAGSPGRTGEPDSADEEGDALDREIDLPGDE